jgi:hypothetical protein
VAAQKALTSTFALVLATPPRYRPVRRQGAHVANWVFGHYLRPLD